MNDYTRAPKSAHSSADLPIVRKNTYFAEVHKKAAEWSKKHPNPLTPFRRKITVKPL